MMKKKITSVFLAMMMILSLIPNVSATGDTGTIKIKDIGTKEFDVYQLFEDDGNSVYTLNSDFTDFEYILNTVIYKNGNDSDIIDLVKDLDSNSTELQAVTKALNDFVCDATDEVKAHYTINSDAGVTVDYGYYLILETTDVAGTKNARTAGILVIINEDNTTATVDLKTALPTIDKQIYDNSSKTWGDIADHQIGDTVNFQINITLPTELTGYDDYVFKISDQMTDGLVLATNPVVYANDADTGAVLNNTDYEYTESLGETSFTIDFTNGIKALVAGKTVEKIVVTYSATLTNEATVFSTSSDRDTNEVTLTYSNDPNDDSSEGTSSDTVANYTYQAKIEKVNGSDAPLADATFALYDTNNGTINGTINLALDGTKADKTYYVTKSDTTVAGVVDTITTDRTGVFYIVGLDALEYTLKETEAPTGYAVASDTIFTITAQTSSGNTNYTTHANIEDIVTTNTVTVNTAKAVVLEVVNKVPSILPTTGGIGTFIFYALGISLLSFGSFIMYKRRT